MEENQRTFTRDEVSAALNRAADFMRDSIDYECEETIRQQTYGDLIVNIALHWLEYPNDQAADAIEQNWNEPAAKVLSWAGIGEYDEGDEDEDSPEGSDAYRYPVNEDDEDAEAWVKAHAAAIAEAQGRRQ